MVLTTGVDEEEAEEDSEEEEDAAEAVNGLLDMFGMGRLKDDAQWLKMEYHNIAKKKMEYGVSLPWICMNTRFVLTRDSLHRVI